MVQGVGFQAALVWKVDFFFLKNFRLPMKERLRLKIGKKKELIEKINVLLG